MRKAAFCHPVYKATSQQCQKQSQPFLWCWTLLLGRSESQLGREVAKLSLLQSSYSWLLKGALLWTVGSVCFSWPFPLPPSPDYVREPCCSCQRKCCWLLQLMEEKRHCTYGIFIQTLFTPFPFNFISVFSLLKLHRENNDTSMTQEEEGRRRSHLS